jgi:serine/threonine protein kinase
MIAFSCHCGLKFSVKDEFAGRQSTCPRCKRPLAVPAPDRTQAIVPAEQIDGTDSSLAKAGIGDGVTLGDDTSRAGEKSVKELLNRRGKAGTRYVLAGEIARGGMGAVLRAVDCDIRREVAIKYLLNQTDRYRKARFVEEAQITGQLEHPNIVPIHELGIDAQQRLFFSMKMVKGRSLAQVLDALRQDPRTAEKEFSSARLLTVFVNVCHALAYAHSRGVVHRDLKPANIMIGDFGEVYVMDWGLAKVVDPDAPPTTAMAPMAIAVPVTASGPASGILGSSSGISGPNSKVMTSRVKDADLTQDGAVVGTPAYMPPEQAMGKVTAVDPRSDVYSLGAILYEMLTLQPPVNKEGGYLAILMRVSQGEIMPPEQRAPQRVKAGKVPRELAAVAMKALAKDPAARYPTVEALRQDIERFLEGRSVSAKDDSTWEVFKKLVRRNRAVSAASVVFVLLLAVAFGFTLKNYLAYVREQKDKDARTRQAVPAFVRAARQAINERQFDDALAQVNVALDFDRNHAAAHLVKGQLLVVRKEYTSAQTELEEYLKDTPQDKDALRLASLCRKARPDEPTLLAFAEAFNEQREFALADGVLGGNLVEARGKLATLYRKRLDGIQPRLGESLSMTSDGKFQLYVRQPTQLSDLAPLRGMALSTLHLERCEKIRDLEPLRGMRLTSLKLGGCSQVTDLAPLADMPLTELELYNCNQLRDLVPLRGKKLTALTISEGERVPDLVPLRGMPLTRLGLFHMPQIRDLMPLQGMALGSLSIHNAPNVRDIRGLQGLPLTYVSLHNVGPLHDLEPLRSTRVTHLEIANAGIRDVAMLSGLKLTRLELSHCRQLPSLEPLRGMPLAHLTLNHCEPLPKLDVLRSLSLSSIELRAVSLPDLKLLENMKLKSLVLEHSPVRDLTPLEKQPLTSLALQNCGGITDLTPLRKLKLTQLDLTGSAVRDLTPLDGMSLSWIRLPPQVDKGTAVLRRMKTLQGIDTNWAGEFWKKYDAGEFKQFKP